MNRTRSVKSAGMRKVNVLVNLPAGFFATPCLKPALRRLSRVARLRKRSHNAAEEIAADLAWADAVIMWSWPALTPELLDGAPRLKFVGHIDVTQGAARVELARGMAVSVSRRGFSPAVAEMALALTLSTLRKVSDYHAAMRQGNESWVGRFPDDIPPEERQLTGRNVGIVGFGGIGRRLAELLAPFGCRLRVYDPFVAPETAARCGARRVPLLRLMRESEIVVLCAASNPGTRRLLGRTEIGALRPGALIVNVARAALVDTDALAARLRKGDICAAIDVFDNEPLPKDSPLRKLPNAYLSPHRAGGILESVERIVAWLVDDLEAHLAGRKRAHALTEEMIPGLDG